MLTTSPLKSLVLTSVLLPMVLNGCALLQPPVAPPGVTDLVDRPAEKALLAGLRAYEDGEYMLAERLLTDAIHDGQLTSAQDQAVAHKHLAFIYCTSNRLALCEAQFRAARVANPAFTLTKSEAGHPQWGPVYQRSLH